MPVQKITLHQEVEPRYISFMGVTRDDAERELEKIIGSVLFRGSGRSDLRGERTRAKRELAGLLRYLVSEELNGRGDGLKESVIQIEYYGRSEFDKADAIVRVNVGRLRKALREYYVSEGINDRVSIDIPNGVCRPVFEVREIGSVAYYPELNFYRLSLESPSTARHAFACFEAAIEEDSENAEAHAGKAMALCALLLHDETASPAECFPEAEARAKQSVALNPNCWRGHATLGALHAFHHDWTKADEEFRKALTIDPIGTQDHLLYGFYLLGRGDYRSTRALAESYKQRHANDVVFLGRAALFLYLLRDFHEAKIIVSDMLSLHAKYWNALRLDALIALQIEMPGWNSAAWAKSTMEGMEESEGLMRWPGLYVLCLAKSGEIKEAQERFDQLLKKTESWYVQPLQLALGCLAVGDHRCAIEWLEKGVEIADPHMLFLHLWPFLDPLRDYQRFKDLLRSTGLQHPPSLKV